MALFAIVRLFRFLFFSFSPVGCFTPDDDVDGDEKEITHTHTHTHTTEFFIDRAYRISRLKDGITRWFD